jgi:hypothetical protein
MFMGEYGCLWDFSVYPNALKHMDFIPLSMFCINIGSILYSEIFSDNMLIQNYEDTTNICMRC